MSNNLRNSDALEEFYHKTFHSEEIEVPADFTDSVMDKLNIGNTVIKKSWSEKIGAKRLFKYLKISMVLNLVTVSTLGYYVLNNKTEVIKIETPLNDVIINEKAPVLSSELEDIPSTVTEQKDIKTEVKKLDKTKVPKVNKEVVSTIPSTVSSESKRTDETVIDTAKIEQAETVNPELVTSDTQEENASDEKVENNQPKSLKDLQSKLRDTIEGKKLFKDK